MDATKEMQNSLFFLHIRVVRDVDVGSRCYGQNKSKASLYSK